MWKVSGFGPNSCSNKLRKRQNAGRNGTFVVLYGGWCGMSIVLVPYLCRRHTITYFNIPTPYQNVLPSRVKNPVDLRLSHSRTQPEQGHKPGRTLVPKMCTCLKVSSYPAVGNVWEVVPCEWLRDDASQPDNRKVLHFFLIGQRRHTWYSQIMHSVLSHKWRDMRVSVYPALYTLVRALNLYKWTASMLCTQWCQNNTIHPQYSRHLHVLPFILWLLSYEFLLIIWQGPLSHTCDLKL